jgi:hypothetical protein
MMYVKINIQQYRLEELEMQREKQMAKQSAADIVMGNPVVDT